MAIRILSLALIVCYCRSVSGAAQFDGGPGSASSSRLGSLQTATNEIQLASEQNWDLRMPGRTNPDANGQSTVSAAQLRVPEKAHKALLKAHEAAGKNNMADAARYVDKALQLYPVYAEALAMRGLLERESDPEAALVDAEKAIEYDPNYGMGYVALGSVYTALARFDDAIHYLEHAIALIPASWQGYYEMTRALVGKRDYTAALRYIEKACSVAPKNYPFFRLSKAAVFIGLNNRSAALTELEGYLEHDPNGENAAEARKMLDNLQMELDHK